MWYSAKESVLRRFWGDAEGVTDKREIESATIGPV
jgi:hypothetical protein